MAAVLGSTGSGSGPVTSRSESELRIDALSQALQSIQESTMEAGRCCDGLTRRARNLDSLTSPASELSAQLTQASSNLGSTLNIMKDAREKFDTVTDCEPAISRLSRGAQEVMDRVQTHQASQHHKSSRHHRSRNHYSNNSGFMPDGSNASMQDEQLHEYTWGTFLSEQDVYAAGDSMEIIRDAYSYFLQRKHWKSTPSALGGLERVHQMGVDAMCLLIRAHLQGAGPAVCLKTVGGPNNSSGNDMSYMNSTNIATTTSVNRFESSNATRARLSMALQNRDLMQTVGEYQEHLSLSTRAVRELRAIFECLSHDGYTLGQTVSIRKSKSSSLSNLYPPTSKVVRTEKIGSGCFCNLSKFPLRTGYPHLDAYAESRKVVSYKSLEAYYYQCKEQRKSSTGGNSSQKASNTDASSSSITIHNTNATVASNENAFALDAAARDAVRALEHTMVIVAGEKSIYRCVVSPTSSHTHDDKNVPQEYKKCLVASYSHVVAGVVDRILDIVETVFMKDIGLSSMQSAFKDLTNNPNSPSGTNNNAPPNVQSSEQANNYAKYKSIRHTASGAAACLRILDGVRMLGPSLAKLCEISSSNNSDKFSQSAANNNQGKSEASLPGHLCISIHRITVKNCSRALEFLAKAITNDPLNGAKHRPVDARVSIVSSEVVRAIRLVAPYVSAYRSVTKRRSLPWDPNIGEEAGDMSMFIRFLIMRLLHNLQGKALNYTRDPGLDSQVRPFTKNSTESLSIIINETHILYFLTNH